VNGIIVEKARENNLREVSVEIPRHRLTTITGVSGSGKSTLACNVIHAEGQRRYLESLSAYARQFLHLFQRPNVESITGLSPTLALSQNQGLAGFLSTVGTLSEVYDFLRLLFHTSATQLCHRCSRELKVLDAAAAVENLLETWPGGHFEVYATLVRHRKGHYAAMFRALERQGYTRLRVNGRVRSLAGLSLSRSARHTIEVRVGTAELRPDQASSLLRTVEAGFQLGRGEIGLYAEDGQQRLLSRQNCCLPCGLFFAAPEPSTFSFHSAEHRCPRCLGRGAVHQLIPESVFSNMDLPLDRIEPSDPDPQLQRLLARVWVRSVAGLGLAPSRTWASLPPQLQDQLLHQPGPASAPASLGQLLLQRLEKLPQAERPEFAHRHFRTLTCPDCRGSRLAAAGRGFRLAGESIGDLAQRPLDGLLEWCRLHGQPIREARPQSKPLLSEIERRLAGIMEIGLGYLSLHRPAESLSGGELQRLRLAARLQREMGGVLYILDEPSIGLHPGDMDRLLGLLRRLREQGNTVLVVEHDAATIAASDHVIDLGPGGGRQGGQVVFAGPVDRLRQAPDSLTGQYLSGRLKVRRPATRRAQTGGGICLEGVTTHNLKDICFRLPLRNLIAVTGVSGSGKSSLVADTLYPLVQAQLRRGAGTHPTVRSFSITGGPLQHVYFVDQASVGRTPRSTPATYTGVFDEIRRFFARLPEAQARGLGAGHFSFNLPAGRCPTCLGMGQVRVEMRFLPDSFLLCPQCQGTRYQPDLHEVRFEGKTIAAVLDLPVSEALDLFAHFPAIRRRLQVLEETGLGYIRLGQPTPSLSGGEQERLRLSVQLLATPGQSTLFLLDEPTTGLHFADVERLCRLVHNLVDQGHTVVAIEHNLDFIQQADWVVDLGPGPGDRGGEILYAGPLEGILESPDSLTGAFLRRHLKDVAPRSGRG